MVNIKPIINFVTKNSGEIATRFVQNPQVTHAVPKKWESLRPALDEVCLSSQKKVISLDEVKALFPTGKLDENNYLFREMNTLWHNVQTPRQKIRLEPELSERDFKIIQDFMNKENGKYIEGWKGFSDTDTVPNIQNLLCLLVQ